MSPILRGEILLVDFGSPHGSEQAYTRPCIVVSGDIENKFAPTAIVIPLTSQQKRMDLPSNVVISSDALTMQSVALTNQIRVIDKQRIQKSLGHLDSTQMEKVDQRLRQVLMLH